MAAPGLYRWHLWTVGWPLALSAEPSFSVVSEGSKTIQRSRLSSPPVSYPPMHSAKALNFLNLNSTQGVTRKRHHIIVPDASIHPSISLPVSIAATSTSHLCLHAAVHGCNTSSSMGLCPSAMRLCLSPLKLSLSLWSPPAPSIAPAIELAKFQTDHRSTLHHAVLV
jgi:hypothetical protein